MTYSTQLYMRFQLPTIIPANVPTRYGISSIQTSNPASTLHLHQPSLEFKVPTSVKRRRCYQVSPWSLPSTVLTALVSWWRSTSKQMNFTARVLTVKARSSQGVPAVTSSPTAPGSASWSTGASTRRSARCSPRRRILRLSSSQCHSQVC